jgi:uncharacterized protein (DUF2141 family)
MTPNQGTPARSRGRLTLLVLRIAASGALPVAAGAADLVVRVTGLTEPLGQVGCSLFASPAGFPMDDSRARQLWLAADAKRVTCRYSDVPERTYAVSIGHDLNSNKRVDTNLIGLPTKQWGVSNNPRLPLRPPRFDEASFSMCRQTR